MNLIVWRKSSYSEAGNCVEIAYTGEMALVRDSKNTKGPVLSFSRLQWTAFISDIKASRMNPPHSSA